MSLFDLPKSESLNIIHKAAKIPPKVSLMKLGEMEKEELSILQNNFPECTENFNWTKKLSSWDIALAKKYNFDPHLAIGGNFVAFGFDPFPYVTKLISKYFPSLVNHSYRHSFCSTYFAHSHDDKLAVDSRGQIMFVSENNVGHTLFSKDRLRNEYTMVPKAGDIIFLNIHYRHAVFPNQTLGKDMMMNNPLKFFAVYIQ